MKPFAFVFPGQGSQSVGMLDAWGDHPVVRETLQEASDALGEDLAVVAALALRLVWVAAELLAAGLLLPLRGRGRRMPDPLESGPTPP